MKFFSLFLVLMPTVAFNQNKIDKDIEKVSIHIYQKLLNESYWNLEEYDKKGNLIANYTLDNDSNVVEYEKSKFDKINNHILHEYKSKDGKIQTRKFIYTDFNETSEVINTDANGDTIFFINFEYDKNENLVKRIRNVKQKSHFDQYTTEFKYNNKNLLIEEIESNKNGVHNTTIYTYFEEKDLLKNKKSIKSSYTNENQYTYTDGGNIATEIILRDNKFYLKYINSYNENNLKTKSVLKDKDGNTTRVYSYDYDQFGNNTLTQESRPNANEGYKMTFTYKYDKFDNWIERNSIQNNSITKTELRHLYYY